MLENLGIKFYVIFANSYEEALEFCLSVYNIDSFPILVSEPVNCYGESYGLWYCYEKRGN